MSDCGFNRKYPRSDALMCSMRLGSSGNFTTTLTGLYIARCNAYIHAYASTLLTRSYRLESAPLRFGSISSI